MLNGILKNGIYNCKKKTSLNQQINTIGCGYQEIYTNIEIIVPVTIEYLGPDYAKYGVWTFALQLLSVKIQLIFEKHWMQSLIAQMTNNKKNSV